MARSFRRIRRSRSLKSPLPQYGVEPTRVLAVGNRQSFIEEISGLLVDEQQIRLLGGAQGRIEAAERLVLLKPDVVVIEIDLDYELGGIDTAFALRRISPSTAFVLVSPHSDPERLAMVPRGLGLEWSYVLSRGGIEKTDLVNAISSASWSIPYIDRRIDRSKLKSLQKQVAEAVEVALRTPKPNSRRAKSQKPRLGYSGSADWTGDVTRFRLPEDGNGNGPGSRS